MANINDIVDRAISDFDNIRDAIRDCGVDVPKGTDTSEYGRLVGEVYEKGGADSFEAGKQAERDVFWDAYQENGNRTNYAYAFSGRGWTDETYRPKHNITTSGAFGYIYSNSLITDTVVPLVFGQHNSTQAFSSSKIQKIPSITVASGQTYTNWFLGCSDLVEIIFTPESVIGSSLTMNQSPLLSVESMKSIIEHLKNYKGTSSDQTYSVTFSDDCWARLEETTPPDGYETWKDYVSDLGWAV